MEVRLTRGREVIRANSHSELVDVIAHRLDVEKKKLRDRYILIIVAVPLLFFILGAQFFVALCVFWAAAELFLYRRGERGPIRCMIARHRDCQTWEAKLCIIQAGDSYL